MEPSVAIQLAAVIKMFHIQLSETNNHLARDTINQRPVYNISQLWPCLPDLGVWVIVHSHLHYGDIGYGDWAMHL